MDNISSLLLQFNNEIRLSGFFGIFIILSFCEIYIPRRQLIVAKYRRWYANLGIIIINSLLVEIIFPGILIIVSVWAYRNNIGILNYLDFPILVNMVVSVLFLDFAIYVQHVAFHRFNFLWKIHKVHHVDLDLDVTTGLRFHPFEIIISLLIKAIIVLAIGISAVNVIIFQIILNTTSMFNHSNISLPNFLDRVLRYLIVTPDMHLVHHSDILEENNSNYGFNLSIWDKIFKTYLVSPKSGLDNMRIGVPHYKDQRYSKNLLVILFLPLKRRRKNF